MLRNLINTIKNNDTIWVMENRENSDRIFKEYITEKLFSSSYAIVSNSLIYIFVHKLDEGNINCLDKKYTKVYIYETQSELQEYILSSLIELNFPKNILLGYTTMSDENTDIITHSSYQRITRLFRKLYRENSRKFNVKSAEMNIYEVISKNSSITIERLKILASITDEILRKSFYSIRLNDTEMQIATRTKDITLEYLNQIKDRYDIADFNFAWDICPIVLVGDNLQKGGHAEPSDNKIKKGDTIYYDFGICATFNDGEKLYTDMQRMGYMLKENEKNAPSVVQKVFDTLVNSIELGIKAMRPNVKAYKIDEIVRGKILENNYPNYPHATGHPVGKNVHGAGALISTKKSKRANLRLVESGVYTLEPRVNIKNGGSIEEMILITKDGAVPLCNVQNELYLI